MGLDFFGGILSAYGGFLINIGNYLSGTQSDAPATSGRQPPYIPPFTGGQSIGIEYYVKFTQTTVSSPYGGNGNSRIVDRSDLNTFIGKITGIESGVFNNMSIFRVFHGNNQVSVVNTGGGDYNASSFGGTIYSYSNIEFLRKDGQPDVGGNVPNPNPAILNPDGGAVDGEYPSGNSTEIVPAALPVLAPNTVAAILAALRNAANLAALAANIADAIEKILEWIKEREDNDPKKKRLVSRQLGAIKKDGFLRLYPFARNGSQAINLDIRFYDIPIWKKDMQLGEKSPNYYYDLARVLFVSETYGIINSIEINYTINSIPIPESAIGFYYHLGLDGIGKAYATAFYLE